MELNESNGALIIEGALSLPPKHLFSDFVEMAYLAFVILVGTTINLHVLRKLMSERRRNSAGGPRNKRINRNSFLILKMNLNISDLFILTILAVGKLTWLASYEWIFGDLFCRLFNFLSMFSLYLSSNIVVCIALDRLRTVVKANRLSLLRKKKNLVCLLVSVAWLLAIAWSIPQLFVWTTYNVLKSYPGGWFQCTDIWSIEHHEAVVNPAGHIPSGSPLLSDTAQTVYDLAHLFLVFYGPLVLLVGCYLTISLRLRGYTSSVRRDDAQTSSNMQNYSHQSSFPVSMDASSAKKRRVCSRMESGLKMVLSELRPPSRWGTSSRSTVTQCTVENPTAVEEAIDEETNPIRSMTQTPPFPTRRNDGVCEESFSFSSHGIRTVAYQSFKRIYGTNLQSKWQSIRRSSANNDSPTRDDRKTHDSNSIGASKALIAQPTPAPSATPITRDMCPYSTTYSGRRLTNSSPTVLRNDLDVASSVFYRQQRGSEPEKSLLRADYIHRHHHYTPPPTSICLPVPIWRRQLKSRAFRTTLLVIVTHVLLWTPYNLYAVTKYVNEEWYARLNEQANVLKDLQLLITLINPFLYGLGK